MIYKQVEKTEDGTFWKYHDRLHRLDGPAIIWNDGKKEWYLHGDRHRSDGPAIEWPDGKTELYLFGKQVLSLNPQKEMQINGRNYRLMQYEVEITNFRTVYRYDGKIHREGGPAIIRMDGVEEWYVNGKQHREDGPAFVKPCGFKHWYINGLLHREDGPASESHEYSCWYINGKLHREDGPAVVGKNGHKEWYIDGNSLTESEFNDLSEQFLKYDGHTYGLILPEKLPYGLRRNP